MNAMIGALLHTPWWVFLIFGYLIVLGIKARQTRIVSLYKIFTIPIVFLCFSIYTVLTIGDYFTISGWAITMVLGGTVSFYHLRRLNIKVDNKHFLIQLPGSWSTLMVMLLIFSCKYYFSYDLAIHPHHAELTECKFRMLASYGLLTGFLQGKLVGYLYHFKNSANSNLAAKKGLNE